MKKQNIKCMNSSMNDCMTSLRHNSPKIKDIADKMRKTIALVIVLVAAVATLAQDEAAKEEKAELLEGSESQNYGYGYGTKVDGPHGSSTVYVHGFGTDDGYGQDGYGGHDGYGYGHIDQYLNTKHGYEYNKGYGYNQVQGYPGYGHHGVAGHGLGVEHHRGHGVANHGQHRDPVISQGLGVANHGHGVGHVPGYGAGYGAPQPFV